MTIEKGAPWGVVAPTPHDVVTADSDEAAARAVARGAKFVFLGTGDLLRALGSHDTAKNSTPRIGEPCLQLPCDILEVSLNHDSEVITAVSSVVVGTRLRPRWWVSAGGFLGALNIAPRAHPNDDDAPAGGHHPLAVGNRSGQIGVELGLLQQRFTVHRHLPGFSAEVIATGRH
ncbi:MAG: hypothetical protein ACO3FC_06150, partial [Ilumatobacteraceae bacterium]